MSTTELRWRQGSRSLRCLTIYGEPSFHLQNTLEGLSLIDPKERPFFIPLYSPMVDCSKSCSRI